MYKSLFPFILASLGYTMIFLSIFAMPFLEWHISDFEANFPSEYEVQHLSSPWRAKLGDSFDDDRYIFTKVSILKDRRSCSKEDLNFVVNRSQSDKAVEYLWLNFKKDFSWLIGWSLIEVALSMIYIFWFGLWYGKGSTLQTVIILGVALCSIMFLIPTLNLVGSVVSPYYAGGVECNSGIVAFTAKLSRIHYETLVLLFAGALAEVGTLWIIVRQILLATLERNEKSNF